MTKTIEKQINESGPKTSDGVGFCFCCQKPIEPGDEYYHAKNNLYTKRHINCARNPCRIKKQKAEGQQTIGRAKNGRVLYSSKHLAG